MEEIGEKSSEEVGDDGGEPEEIVIVKNNTGEKSIDEEVENCNNDTDDSEKADAGRGFWFCRDFGFERFFGFHKAIIA